MENEKGAKKEQEKKSLFSHVLTQQLLGYHIWRDRSGEKRSFAFLTPPPISLLISNF